jgi:hypothetical protein
MITGIKLDATRKYVSKLDPSKGTKDETVFEIGTLDSRIMGRIMDKATTITVDPARPEDEVSTQVNSSEAAFETVMYGLRGWSNFQDGDGNDIEFKTVKRNHGGASYKVADEALIKLLPRAVIIELAEEIRKDNELTETETKN